MSLHLSKPTGDGHNHASRRRIHQGIHYVLEVLNIVCGFLDAKHLLSVSQLNRSWRMVADAHFSPDARSYFRHDWIQDPVELALPSVVLAISTSVDETQVYVCARGTDPDDTALLYLHDVQSGQRSFEDLPEAFSEPSSQITFVGPHWLRCVDRNCVITVFDCHRGLELRLPTGTASFVASSSGRFVGVTLDDGSCTVVPFGEQQRQKAIDQAQLSFEEVRRRGSRHQQQRSGGADRRIVGRSSCAWYALDLADAMEGSFTVGAATLDGCFDAFVGRAMLLTVQTSVPGRGGAVTIRSFFLPGGAKNAASRPSESTVAATGHAEDDGGESPAKKATRCNVLERIIRFPFASCKCTPHVVECVEGGGTLMLMDPSGGTLHVWTPRLDVLRAVAFPQLLKGLSAHRHHDHPGTAASPSLCVEDFHVLVPTKVICFTTSLQQHQTAGGVGPSGDRSGHHLNFASLDGSMWAHLPLKGKSLVTVMPQFAQVLVALCTRDTSNPPHPLLEATEYGIGTMLKFGRAQDVVRRESASLESKGRRIVWITWISSIVMGVSLATIVVSLVYNGWWLHMQFLFTTPPPLSPASE